MSAVTASNTRTIYVALLDEGTLVLRPTQGVALAGGVYRLLPTLDYDPEDEHWEFAPGSLVRCVKEIRNNEEVLIARELVHEPVSKPAGLGETVGGVLQTKVRANISASPS